MPQLSRVLVTSLITALALMAGLLAPPAGAAQRSPDDRVRPQSTQPVSYKHRATVSKSQMAGLRIAKDVANKASKGKTLDYRKAAKRWASTPSIVGSSPVPGWRRAER